MHSGDNSTLLYKQEQHGFSNHLQSFWSIALSNLVIGRERILFSGLHEDESGDETTLSYTNGEHNSIEGKSK